MQQSEPCNCLYCGQRVHEARLEMGYEYCVDCAASRNLIKRSPVIIMGQHKGPPLVFSLDEDVIKNPRSLYDRG